MTAAERAAEDLRAAGVPCDVEGGRVVLDVSQASALTYRLRALRERVERAEAPPY